MARLFSLADAGAVDDPEFGHFEPGDDGSFDFPDELSDRLHRLHHRGRPAWENEEERRERCHGEDLARRRDPAMLYDAVGEFSGALKQFAGMSGAVIPADAAAEIADLKRQLAELRGDAVPDAGDTAEPVAKTARPRSKSTPVSS
jgi:hypothetical protein